MSVLAPRDAYRLWAAHYERETVVSCIEDRLVASLGVPTAGRRLLDVGCGTGRRLRGVDAAARVGVDLTREMLAAGAADLPLAAADVRALPLAASAFHVVWCRLVVGHVRELGAAYAELARVCRPGGAVVVSDLSAESAAAGHRRTFRDARGTVHEIEHHVHPVAAHVAAAWRAGLTLVTRRTGVVDASVRRLYADAGRLTVYDAQRGLPLVVALAFRKPAEPRP
jgi:malonyl-CoA O-methyltransferase